jgi:hypothetical protein
MLKEVKNMAKRKDYNEELFDISDRILQLSDELSEEIILANIKDQLESELELFTDRRNYLTLFREKYASITPESSFYNKAYVREALERVTSLVKMNLQRRYGLTLGKELDFYFPEQYLMDMENIYEFFFIRHFENLVTYFNTELKRTRPQIIERYSKIFQEDQHSKDVFALQAKKKFKNRRDVIIIHFINDIIKDLIESNKSAYVLFEKIVNADSMEEVNNSITNLLKDYGAGLAFEGDIFCYDLYMKPLENQEIRNELRNEILMKYLETCEIEE